VSLQQQVIKRISRTMKANRDSKSIRITVPKSIAHELGLDIDNNIEWDISVEKGQKFARFRKL
jgi:hypothetical protein